MVIEAWINGERQTYREVPEERLWDHPGATWSQNAQFRETVINQERQKLEEDMRKIFHPGILISYRLIFPSKMNSDGQDCQF